MDIISSEVLLHPAAGQKIQGIALIGNYTVKTTKNGKEYIDGKIQSGESLRFMVWSDRKAFEKLRPGKLANKPCAILGQINEFQGSFSVIIDDIKEAEGYSIGQFLPEKYDSEEWFQSLRESSDRLLSEKGRKLLDRMLFSNIPLTERLREEFAAMNHHDNCKGGLLAHTVKMLDVVPLVFDNYRTLISERDEAGNWFDSQDKKDLLVIGCILHDIGKTREMNYGVYQKNSFVTHRYFGAEYVEGFKQEIVESYSEKWFYDMIAILLQHHDEFGDPCRNIYALIVHKIDDLESSLTNLCQEIETDLHTDPSGDYIWYDKKTLYV